MNKNKNCLICEICFVFLISLLWYILIFYAIPNGLDDYNKPDFKITEEKCWNESDGMRYTDCQLGCYYSYDNTNMSLKEYSNCNIWCMNVFEKEVCEDVEVEEIDIHSGKYEGNYEEIVNKINLAGVLKLASHIEGSCDYNNENCVFYVDRTYISKEDITINWLEGNCELEKVYSKISKGFFYCDEDSCSVDICSSKNYDCINFNCGNYKVEVLK